jgi:hypothetical protein
MKNKKELIEEVNKLAQEHAFKKSVVEKMLNDLDQKTEFTEAHSEGMSVIEDMMREMDEIWSKSEELKKEIRSN